MKFSRAYTLEEIASKIGCNFVGDKKHIILGINEIHRVQDGDLVFVDHPKYYKKALESSATTILIDKEVECPAGKALIISSSPFDDFNRLTEYFCPIVAQTHLINKKSEIDPTATIYPNVFIGKDVKIGANTYIYSNVVLMDRTIIEDNVIIGPNTTIGHNAFYYQKKEDQYHRLHTCGGVHIHSNVEIGANCTIDAGVSATTEIGEGTKIDNHVHIGHDTIIGKHCLLAANVGLSGCVTLHDRVCLWGQVGCASDIVIGEGVIVLAQSGIAKNLESNKTYFGSPCGEVKSKFREMAALRRLPELIEQM